MWIEESFLRILFGLQASAAMSVWKDRETLFFVIKSDETSVF